MTSILAFAWPFSEAAIERLGWVLVHSLWQLAAAAMLAGVVVRTMRRNSAAARYTLLVFAMALAAAAPVATGIFLPDDARGLATDLHRPARTQRESNGADRQQTDGEPLAAASLSTTDLAAGEDASHLRDIGDATEGPRIVFSDTLSQPTWTERAANALRPWLSWIVVVWSAGVAVCSLRPLLGWRTLRRLRRIGVSPASEELLGALERVASRLGIRRAVHVMHSTLAQVPIVVGYLRPVVLVPVGLAANIPAAQLEAILAHELAHVLRHDFVVNLMQTSLETVFFYHPAVWWLSRRIRIEREHCCDDLVIARFDNRVEYGRALLAIDEMRGSGSLLALGAADGSLLARIRRIVGAGAQGPAGGLRERSPAALISLGCLGLALVLSLTWRLAAKDAEENVSLQPGRTTKVTVKTESPPELPPAPEKLRGIDLSKTPVRRMVEAQDKTPDLYVRDPENPGFWTQAKNVFEMPLAEHTWLKYPTGSGHFYIEHRPDGTWQNEQLYGPIAGDPFELLKLDDFLREKLKSGDATHRLRLMFRTGDPGLVRRAWRLIEPMLGRELPGRDEGLFGRIELLNVVRDALRDDAAALRDPALRVVVARMRKTVSETEETIDARNDALPDSSYQEVTYRQHKLALKIPEALWGKPLDGLRLALVPREWEPNRDWNELPRDTRLPPSVVVQSGATLEYQLVVENVSDHEIKMCGYPNGEEIARMLEVIDKNGKRVEIRSIHTTIPAFHSYWRLKAGERELLSLPAVHFTPPGPQKRDQGLGYFVTAAPGDYTLRCGVWFGDLDNTRHRHVPGKSEWIGQLTTGTQKITVAGPGAAEPETSARSPEPAGDEEKAIARPEPTGKSATAKGLEFLASYPKLQGLSLDMTEKDFVALAERENLGPRKTSVDGGTQYRVPTGDGHTVIVMFGKGAEKCTGIQRIRGDDPTPAFILPDHLNVMAVGFDRDGKNLVSVATENQVSIRTWDMAERNLKQEVSLESDKHGNRFLTGHLTLSADRTRVLAILDGQVGIWETATGRLVKTLTLPNETRNGMIRGLDCTPDLSLVACGWMSRAFGSAARAVVWDVDSGEVLQTVTHVDAVQVHCVALSPDGKWLATGSQQAGACVWDVGSGEELYALPNENEGRKHPDPEVSPVGANQVLCLRFAPDSRQLAMVDMLGVKLIDARSGKLLHSFDAPFRFGWSGLVFSRDGRMLARTATDKVVPIWSTETGKLLAELPTEAHDGSFSPDSQWFAVGFTDQHNALAVWRLP
jgi:hypothetical protein